LAELVTNGHPDKRLLKRRHDLTVSLQEHQGLLAFRRRDYSLVVKP
jgi:hypothetical protein